MRILYVSDAASIHTKRWAEYFRDRGASVHIASLRPAKIQGVDIHVLRTYGLGKVGYLCAIPALRKLIRTLKPDVVHAQYITSYGFIAAAAGAKPLVLTAWGTDVLITPKKSATLREITRYALEKAAAITTVADHMNASVAELCRPGREIKAIPFGVDTELFEYTEPTYSEAVRIISTRNFAPVYDIPTLISALGYAQQQGVNFTADLIGDGPQRHDIAFQIKSHTLSDRVKMHGHLKHSELIPLLQDADIFVTSALSDGNNVSLNEAMSCGCFPIATDIPANAQWIDNGVTGILYAPGDARSLAAAISQAAANFEQRKSAAAINRKLMEEKADWAVCASSMTATYERVMSLSS